MINLLILIDMYQNEKRKMYSGNKTAHGQMRMKEVEAYLSAVSARLKLNSNPVH